MLSKKEAWTISWTANPADMPKDATLVFDSTGTITVNGVDWGTWTGNAPPYGLHRLSNGQNYQLTFAPGTEGGPDELTCWPQVTSSASAKPIGSSGPQKKKGKKNGKVFAPKAEAQSSSWTAQGGTQGGTGGAPCAPLPKQKPALQHVSV
jgi:hypothetical protein